MQVEQKVLHQHVCEDDVGAGGFHVTEVDEVAAVLGLIFGGLGVGWAQEVKMTLAAVLQGDLEFAEMRGEVHLWLG